MTSDFAPYAERYQNTSGPGDARPTALEIVRDNDLAGKWARKVVLVTGGTSGIGVETVRALHATGADVYFTARDTEKGQKTLRDISSRSDGSGKLEVIDMDLDSLDSVRAAAQAFLGKSDKLNLLVNNAGMSKHPASTDSTILMMVVLLFSNLILVSVPRDHGYSIQQDEGRI